MVSAKEEKIGTLHREGVYCEGWYNFQYSYQRRHQEHGNKLHMYLRECIPHRRDIVVRNQEVKVFPSCVSSSETTITPLCVHRFQSLAGHCRC